MVHADDASFAGVAEAPGVPVLVDLWAPWCGPCRTVSPALERLAQSYAGRLKLVKVNVDTSPRLSQRFDVASIPTLMVLRGGQVLARQTGAAPEAALAGWFAVRARQRRDAGRASEDDGGPQPAKGPPPSIVF
ncbi:MAG: thioredoxin [Actinomycetota bacterium]